MKQKFYSLLVIVFSICMMTSFMVSADVTNKDYKYEAVTKVNKTIKLKKKIKLSEKIKDYTFTSDNKSIATVSDKGVITSHKAGTAVITINKKADGEFVTTVTVTVKNRYSKKQLRLLSSLIYCEAGNESYAGKKAVGIVVMNRVRSSAYPNTLKEVIYQPYQFSPARNGSLKKSLALYDSGDLDSECIKAAKATLNADTTVILNGETIEMNDYLFFSGKVNGCRLTIGSHQFK